MSDRLREARKKAGFPSASAAAEAFGWQIPAYIHHENGTRTFTVEAAKRYARAFRVNPGWLLALDKVEIATAETSRGRIVEVTGSVAAGVWRETTEWPQSDRFEIVVGPSPFPRARRFGLRVDGNSMDQVFAPGTLLDCLSIFDLGIEPANGDLVIVERQRRDGMRELTAKEFHCDEDGRCWLIPRSTKPEFQSPIEIGSPNTEHETEDYVQVIAFVIGSYQPHASRLLKFMRNGEI
jgi:phage repressor protein C with HTH and peptisase S24 domain